jgi:acetyl esterase/lipase
MKLSLRISPLPIALAATVIATVTALSAAVGQTPALVKKTFTYKVVGEAKIEADVYRTDDEVAQPVLVWIHGGALMLGTRASVPPRLLNLCQVAGFVLVSIDYRLAPDVELPAIVEDLQDAFTWIREEGPTLFHADPDRIVVAGGSAGGYLTLTSGFRIRPRPTALVSFWGYGALDTFDAEPSEYYRSSQPLVSEEEAYRQGSWLLYLYLRQNGLWTKVVTGFDPNTEGNQLDPYAPIRNVTPDYPPIMLIHGTNDTDVPYEESVAMAEQLTQHGVAHELILVPEGGHGLGGADEQMISDAHNRALAFIHQHLVGEARAKEVEPLLTARATLDVGLNHADQGKITEAIEAYAQAQVLEPRLRITAWEWSRLCGEGSLWGFAAEVMPACEEAVKVARPDELGWMRADRGLARGLIGDQEGAVSDFEYFLSTGYGNARQRTLVQGWVAALRAGESPFTAELLDSLRNR